MFFLLLLVQLSLFYRAADIPAKFALLPYYLCQRRLLCIPSGEDQMADPRPQFSLLLIQTIPHIILSELIPILYLSRVQTLSKAYQWSAEVAQ